jgi:hypothetical protein
MTMIDLTKTLLILFDQNTKDTDYGVFHLSNSTKMHTTRVVMGRGSVSTHHGQKRILKHATPDLVTYIQKVQ